MISIIYDTETTGLPKSWSAPYADSDNWPRLVSLSWILTDGKKKAEFDFIIKPEGFEIPENVAQIHGITTEKALAEGQDLSMVLTAFRACLVASGAVVAHNLSFDLGILSAEYFRLYKDERFNETMKDKKLICTMLTAHKAGINGNHGGQGKWPKLIELYQNLFNESFEGAHNSMADTRACERIFNELINRNIITL
jgi:DNA polymerase III epsilon subunit-like protein